MVNIAIVSTNRDRYSETFIQNHLRCLPGNIFYLFEGHLPQMYSEDKGKTHRSFKDERLAKWLHFRKSGPERLLHSIKKYLKSKQIDVILCEYGPSGVEILPVAQSLQIPLVVHFHGYDAYRNDILEFYGKPYQKMFDYAASIIAVSKDMYAQLQGLGCNSGKIRTLCYGVDTSIFKDEEMKRDKQVFVACARFVEKKSPQSTIQAFHLVRERLPEAKLIMIGDGELLGDCKTLCSKLDLDRSIEFKGALNQLQIAEIFNRASAFVQHSVRSVTNDSEGTPLSILEAMACGLPIISTRHGGIPDIITDKENGFLVEQHNIEEMADRMLQVLSDPENATHMGRNNAEKAIKDHNLSAYTERLWQILESHVE